ncbi:MAG: glycerol-3-phosphate responsive antiterminator [Clostridium sp.]|nr:glycerol-3-phosphate responsive antiterminator [Clostridium sp.]
MGVALVQPCFFLREIDSYYTRLGGFYLKHHEFVRAVEANPVIAAVKSDEGLRRCLDTDIGIVFTLYGELGSIEDIVKQIKDAGKIAMVHIDLVNGMQPKEVSLDFIRNRTEADGIITTKYSLVQHAKNLELNSVLRMFMLDSTSLETLERYSRQESVQPDVMEILPGTLLPDVIRRANQICRVPVMASGLITRKEEIMNALKNGAISVSTTSEKLWNA